MKITKTRIQEIISEELQKIKLQEEMENLPEPVEMAPEEPDAVQLTVSKLRSSLKQLAVDSPRFKGVDANEATMIADFINRILSKAQEGSAKSVFMRVNRALERLKI
tara:strand:+ start:145 stop:465 length:321 start_codon:yes stop_codon:yes gene_type:complete